MAGLCAGFCLGAVFVVEFVVLVRRLVEGAAWGWLVLLGLRLAWALGGLVLEPAGLGVVWPGWWTWFWVRDLELAG